jgi:hypothetical protein
MDISSREEQVRQENPTLEALENTTTTVDTLVNLQDLHEPIVTSSAINPSQEKVCYL